MNFEGAEEDGSDEKSNCVTYLTTGIPNSIRKEVSEEPTTHIHKLGDAEVGVTRSRKLARIVTSNYKIVRRDTGVGTALIGSRLRQIALLPPVRTKWK